MSDFDHGPLQTWELTWASGHVERISGHQVTWPQQGANPLAEMFGQVRTESSTVRYVHFHGQIDGQWRLILSAREDDLRTIRNVTDGEPAPGGAA